MCISFHYRFEIIYIIISTITYGLKETSKTILQNRHKEYKKNISFLTGLIKYFAIISMIFNRSYKIFCNYLNDNLLFH